MEEETAMIGLDTGFFVELLKGNVRAIEIWQNIIDGDECTVSCLTLYELRRLCLKGILQTDTLNLDFAQ